MQASVEMPPMARLITIIVQAMVIVSAMRHVIIISLNVGTILYVSKPHPTGFSSFRGNCSGYFRTILQVPRPYAGYIRRFMTNFWKKGFVVDDDTDEYAAVINGLSPEIESRDRLHLTINPTLDCNFMCWYCYEDHLSGSFMNADVIEAVKRFISRSVSEPDLRRMVISFFGGEPMLYYGKIIKPLIRHSLDVCRSAGKNVDFYMTTNAWLFTPKVTDELDSMGVRIGLQIPFDGGGQVHDKTKHLKDGSGTYAKVRDNAIYAARSGFPVTVRCNYTHDNILSFMQVAEDFRDVASLPGFEVRFHRIWQEKEDAALREEYAAVKGKFKDYGYDVGDNAGRRGLCYADKLNSLVINYDGLIYKCTARNFEAKHSAGVLNPDGTVTYNDSNIKRLSCKYKSKSCRECLIFPICFQTCSQNVLEARDPDGCVADNSPEAVERTVRARLRTFINGV